MTDLLFQRDSYLKEFEAKVVEVNREEAAVVLEASAFYPGGGGQPNDVGSIRTGDLALTVRKVKRNLDQVWHLIDGELPAVATMVRGHIDWEHRYRLMRTHTALHVLCGVVWRDYGAQVTGGNMEPLKGRMDFEFEALGKELVVEIEEKINFEIDQGREIKVGILPREEAFRIPDLIRTKINLLPKGITEVRTVEIVGLDLQADGGTHVANTREVGHVRILDYKSKGRLNKRILIEIDE